ncbi:hypothetical protein [Ekhidna lutea]|uniref:hypothetical protein n=1 Tax=Ekhidna lutea TaxID=447679 RepID=UPI00117DA24A|nr:hypothetical protein [Ekhidna lutea]
MKRLIILIFVPLLLGCSKQSEDHPVFKYYPPDDVFEEGYASKFYTHYLPKNTDGTKRTRINYSVYEKTGIDKYTARFYNAGFELTGQRYYSIVGTSMRLDSGMRIWRADTTIADIRKPFLQDFINNEDVVFEEVFESNGKIYKEVDTQLSVSDTIISGIAGKILKSKAVIKDHELDSIVNQYVSESYYLEELGYYGGKRIYDESTYQTELIEQMPLSKFEKLSNHNKRRVAYIDPENTISDDADFKICGHETRIADYYNSTPDGRYLHSKQAMLDTIYSNLDKAKLFDQSGRLVFRFVVNCEGKAGRFVVDGYDLNYQPIEFRQETIDHLYGILQKLEDWRSVTTRNEARDAYFYITFNIDNGEIIDILP